jgi:TPR repeat protein
MGSGEYDVFLSYARSDGAAAGELNGWLCAQGLNTFFDRKELRPGLRWVPALEDAIGRAKAVAILVGAHGLGNTQQYERELALIRQTGDAAFPVIPVMMPGCDSPPTGFLQLLTWVDLSKRASVLQQADSLTILRAALRGEIIAAASMRPSICPYRGLEPFREEDAAFFCGRDDAIRELVARVQQHSFVAVVGPSGSGKSSLVFAGLLPALRQQRRTTMWDVVTLRPGASPLRALAAAFGSAPDKAGPAAIDGYLEGEVAAYRTGDADKVARIVGDRLDATPERPDRLLIYVDQWEELYAMAPATEDNERVRQHSADVERFIALLLAATTGRSRASVVLTVRADFYNPLMRSPSISALLPRQQVNIPPMRSGDLRSAVETPAQKAGLSFAPPELVDHILNDVGFEGGRLPLLQFALKETWEKRTGDKLTAEAYTAVGGVAGAIEKTAQNAYDRLTLAQQDAARRLFLRLVNPGEGQVDTRARSVIPDDPQQRDVINLFANPKTRLLVTGVAALQGSSPGGSDVRATVEVAHEALIQRWSTLRTWVNVNREKLRARAAILRAVEEWEEKGKRDDMLLPAGLQLERARSLLADPGDITTDDIKEFILKSLEREEAAQKRAAEAHRQQVRIRNFVIAGVSCLALLAAGLGWSARQQSSRAEAARKDAVEQLGIAEEQRKQADDILAGATNIIAKILTRMDKETQKQVFAVFQTGALHGDLQSMSNLGLAYENGWGVAADYAAARQWLRKAADNGGAAAMINLGRLYENGHGVTQDYAKAREWYEKAADKGFGTAMSNLGALYENGHGVAQDYAKAREWYERGADAGDATSMSNLGAFYLNGYGVPPDYAKARKWLEKAAENGVPTAMFNLGVVYANGYGVPKDLAEAREWFEKAAENGDATAMHDLGVTYANGLGVSQDYAKARQWYEKAADNGDATAMYDLGTFYENGYGVAQDRAKAGELYQKAADMGDAEAIATLEKLPSREAAAAGRYAEALQLQEALAAKQEAAETKRQGRPGKETAQAVDGLAWYAVLARQFTKALGAAERAHALLPDNLSIEADRAYALMFSGRGDESEAIYLAHKGQRMSDQDSKLWESVIAKDFAELRKAGLTHPMMVDIERKLGVSP